MFKEGTTGIEGVALDVEVLNEADGIYTFVGDLASSFFNSAIELSIHSSNFLFEDDVRFSYTNSFS